MRSRAGLFVTKFVTTHTGSANCAGHASGAKGQELDQSFIWIIHVWGPD